MTLAMAEDPRLPLLERVRFLARCMRAPGFHLLGDAEQRLHVMADFMRDHVGAGEVAGCAEALRQFLEKREIEVDIAVTRAIKRPRRRAGEAGTVRIAPQ